MILRLMTFLGSFAATYIWFALILLIDISAPKQEASFYAPILICSAVAGIFVATDIFLKLNNPERFQKLVFNTAIVSIVGSLSVIGGFTMIILVWGLVSGNILPKDISHEMTGFLFLVILMVVSNFAFVMPLRSFGYMFLKIAESKPSMS